jgi:hypothetical protein
MILLGKALILSADAISGETPITLALGGLLLAAVVAYVDEKVSTRHRLAALERSDEAHLKAAEAMNAKHQKESETWSKERESLKQEIFQLRMMVNPPRSGSWPAIGSHDP